MDFSPEYEGGTDEVRRLLQEKRVPRISEMFSEARMVGEFRLVACSAGLEYMGVDSEAVTKQVDHVLGLPAILALTAGAETTLFI
jgi:peroxiredoxin family protein